MSGFEALFHAERNSFIHFQQSQNEQMIILEFVLWFLKIKFLLPKIMNFEGFHVGWNVFDT